MPPVKLGELLVKAKLLQESQLNAALAEQKRWGGKLGDILVRMNSNFEDVIVRALSKQLNFPIADIAAISTLPAEVLKRVPVASAQQMCVLPIQFRDEGRSLVVAMSEPQNLHHVDTLRALSGCRIVPQIAAKSVILQGLRRFYNSTIVDVDSVEDFQVTRSQGEFASEDDLDPFIPASRTPMPVAAPAAAALSAPTPFAVPGKGDPVELRAILELLIDKGLLTREEYLAKVRKLIR